MDSRAQFEEYIRRTFTYALLERHDEEEPFKGEYIDASRETEWEQWQAAWQESRAAIEVELPAYRDAKTHGFSAFNDAMDLCENEIRKHGISIKEELPLQHEAKEE